MTYFIAALTCQILQSDLQQVAGKKCVLAIFSWPLPASSADLAHATAVILADFYESNYPSWQLWRARSLVYRQRLSHLEGKMIEMRMETPAGQTCLFLSCNLAIFPAPQHFDLQDSLFGRMSISARGRERVARWYLARQR